MNMGKIAWIIGALLCTQPWSNCAQVFELAPIACNDKSVEKLSRLAITYINEDRNAGYKFALNRIFNVHLHAQGPAGNVYYLDLDVLETKCHIRSPKPWKHCTVRPFMETQISGNCNTTVLHTPEGFSYLYSYDCTLVPDPPEKLLKTCPDCPLLLPVDSPQALAAAKMTLARHNAQSTLPSPLALLRVMRAAAKNAPVPATFVEYTVVACPEGHMHLGGDTCVPTSMDQEPTGFCSGSVFGHLDGQVDVQTSCETFKAQVGDVARPIQPQVHNVIPFQPEEQPYPSKPRPAPPAIPFLLTAAPHVPFHPYPPPPAPDTPAHLNPSFVANPNPVNPSPPLTSESSESSESLESDSSEELGGAVVRPPSNFRYRPQRRKRQAPVTSKPPHTPVFLPLFPTGPSPFRSCPGPSRYTTV